MKKFDKPQNSEGNATISGIKLTEGVFTKKIEILKVNNPGDKEFKWDERCIRCIGNLADSIEERISKFMDTNTKMI